MGSSTALRLQRYKQDPGNCSLAAAASVSNYYDKRIDYDLVKEIVQPDGQGLYTPEIAILMNTLGFNSVTIVSANIEQFDFKWQGLSRNKLLEEMKRAARWHPDDESKEIAKGYVKFLANSEYENNLVIDVKFGDHIRKHLDAGKPVMASFNWNLFFNYPKWNEKGEVDPLKGFFEEHEIVIYGYDEKEVYILDSHHEMYKGKLKKYASGRYTMSWETLMTVMGFGDLILVDDFVQSDIEIGSGK
jgi:uncharacterized protein YvpB